MHEGVPNQENLEVTKEAVVESLKNNPEDLSSLNKFLDKRQEGVESSKDTLNLNIELAEIYRDAGLLDNAYEAFLDARDQALQEGADELAARLEDEATKLMIE